MATQVTMEDGTESPLVDHIRDAHQKGTRGYTEEYLDTMHRSLHQRKREPEEELEHRHPDAMSGGDGAGSQDQRSSGAMDSRQRDREAPSTPETANSKHRDRDEQEMSATMKSKHRDRDGQRNGQDQNKHHDRYAPGSTQVPGQRTGQPQGQGMQGMPDDMNGDMNGGVNGGMNGDQREHEDLVSAGGRQRNGKHRKQRR